MANDAPFILQEDKRASKTELEKLLNSYSAVSRGSYGDGAYHRPSSFRGLSPSGPHSRNPYQRGDYDAFRPNEAIPRTDREIIQAGMYAYYNIGIIYNVINLMSDFGSQGIRISHPNQSIEKFAQAWFKWVKGSMVSNMFLNLLYRAGNVPIRRIVAKVRNSDAQRIKVHADSDIDADAIVEPTIGRDEIPARYMFYNPLSLTLIAPELTAFTGKPHYAMELSKSGLALAQRALEQASRNQVESQIIKNMPKDILQAIRSNKTVIPIPPEKFVIYHYKKDDWQPWAYPITFPIMPNLILLEKMQQADKSALDSIICSVRLWKLGSLEHKIFPTAAALRRLESMLLTNSGSGSYDVVWGPEIDFKESESKAHQFLGKAKYEPVLSAIYEGLGIPSMLRGDGSGGGMTTNFVSMKTLIERLDYGRKLLIDFWESELRILAQSRGWSTPPTVEFVRASLEDEAAKRQILLHLWDRDILGDEDVLIELEKDPTMVEIRKRREARRRKRGLLPPKASPFHDPEREFALEKIFAQTGVISPSEVGLELQLRKPGEQTGMEMKEANSPAEKKQPVGEAGEGRPKGKKDSVKRKQRTPKPNAAMANFNAVSAWAREAYSEIVEIIEPVVLSVFGKKNLRQLNREESEVYEHTKFHLLLNVEPFEEISKDAILAKLTSLEVDKEVDSILDDSISLFKYKAGHFPNIDERRNMQLDIYSTLKCNED